MIHGRDVFTNPKLWREWPARFWRIYWSDDREEYFGSRGFIPAAWISTRIMADDLLISLGLRPTHTERLRMATESMCKAFDQLNTAMVGLNDNAEELWRKLRP